MRLYVLEMTEVAVAGGRGGEIEQCEMKWGFTP